MTILKDLYPQFLARDFDDAPFESLFNYRRVWFLAVSLIAMTALGPLVIMATIDHNITRAAVDSEARLRTARVVSNAKRSLSFHLGERLSALQLIVRERPYASLADARGLDKLLADLKESFGGFVDLGLIDESGVQVSYAGPYSLRGRDYVLQEWFRRAVSGGEAVSKVFMGYRNAPHLVAAVRHAKPGGGFFVLRATLDTATFNELARLELASSGDSFVINFDGVLQTPSQSHGGVMERLGMSVPPYSEHTEVFEARDVDGSPIVVGYAYIPNSPFVLMVTKSKQELLKSWTKSREELLWFLVASVVMIVVVILSVSTYLVNRIYNADMNRVAALRQTEHISRMATIGRLAAGVAHEVNNPLAVIGEKAGLLKDLITYGKGGSNERVLGLVDDVLRSVERCGTITKRLLGFARHLDLKVETVDLGQVVGEVLDFLHKEAEYRSIEVAVDVSGDVPPFRTDRGKLQQILLNIVNNAMAAMSDGGNLEVTVRLDGQEHVAMTISDDGSGIPEKHLKRIFEPFFTTKGGSGGTGLGLSITFGLVQKLGGTVSVVSKEGQGTSFTVVLPLQYEPNGEKACEYC